MSIIYVIGNTKIRLRKSQMSSTNVQYYINGKKNDRNGLIENACEFPKTIANNPGACQHFNP